MKKILYRLILSITVLSLTFACARTATDQIQNKVMQFIFKVKGKMLLNNSNITYYVILYAPQKDPDIPFDTRIGPRVNAPDLTKGTQLLEGRLPFVGQLPGDEESKWTDFFYITSSAGETVVGRGRKYKGNYRYKWCDQWFSD